MILPSPRPPDPYSWEDLWTAGILLPRCFSGSFFALVTVAQSIPTDSVVHPDSIDLQDHDAPSAKDHKHPAGANGQSLAPHQAETLREVAAETKEDRRVSWTNGDISDIQQYVDGGGMYQQDPLALAQNGASAANRDGDMSADEDGDLDDDDDDMMDKISSSPSIEDGEDTPKLPTPWPARIDSLRNQTSPTRSPVSSEPRSSSPYLDRPDYLPLPLRIPSKQSSKASAQEISPCHRLTGEYNGPNRHDNTDDVFSNLSPDDDPSN